MSTICLNMIVKNEASIIVDTLTNILDNIHIDYWVIADTGSDDGTQSVIQTFFQQRGIPGELLQHEWKNFGHNRELALQGAQGKTDYVFFFDADDRFEGTFTLPDSLTATIYNFYLTNMVRTTRYPRRLLVKNDGSCEWVGVLHEVITAKNSATSNETYIEGDYHVISGRFGARNQNPNKYLDDARMLEEAYAQEQNQALKRRYAYYCGQSYRDCNQPEAAALWYERNIELCSKTGEEVRFSYIALGTEYRKLNDSAKTLEAWWNAYNAAPQHAEALGLIAEYLYVLERYNLGLEVAKKASTLPDPQPHATLFVNEPVHRYVIWYELGRHAVKLSLWDDAYASAKHLLNQVEHSDALNNFILSILEALKGHIERDTFANAKQIQHRIAAMQQLQTDDTRTKHQGMVNWFALTFATHTPQ